MLAVIANGARQNILREVLKGERIGTLFVKNPEIAQTCTGLDFFQSDSMRSFSFFRFTVSPQSHAIECRRASQVLRNLSAEERKQLLVTLITNLEKSKEAILGAFISLSIFFFSIT